MWFQRARTLHAIGTSLHFNKRPVSRSAQPSTAFVYGFPQNFAAFTPGNRSETVLWNRWSNYKILSARKCPFATTRMRSLIQLVFMSSIIDILKIAWEAWCSSSVDMPYMAVCLWWWQMPRKEKKTKISWPDRGLARTEPALKTTQSVYYSNTEIYQSIRKPTTCYLLIYSPYTNLDTSVIVFSTSFPLLSYTRNPAAHIIAQHSL